jgi:TonB-linked SusC/RagA family outer membrane protein
VIKLQQSNSSSNLEGVVVVGYGTQRARNLTGAVSRVQARDIRQVAVTSLDQALQGRVAGVLVTENSGEPGGDISIRIRGIASINNGSDPLIVVDGVPMSVNLNAINPNDIESIDVLRDAASSAIYGSRGSAGVILVTTKRGKAGRVTVAFDGYTSMQQITRKIPMLNGPEFAKLANENLVAGGIAPNPEWSNPNNVLNTDWQDELFRTAPMQNFNLSISGGSEKTRSFLSFGYTKQDGIIENSGYERFTSRLNSDYDISNKLKVGVTLTFNADKRNNVRSQEEFWGVILNVLRARPTDPVYTDQVGPFGDHLYGFKGYAHLRLGTNNNYYALSNPLFVNNLYKIGNRNNQLLSNAFAELEIIKGLKLRSTIGYNINDGFGYYKRPFALPTELNGDPTYVNESWSKGMQWNWINTLTYTREIGKHNFTLLAGTDALKNRGRSIFADGQRAPENQLSVSAAARATRNAAASEYIPGSLFSILGRLNYSYDEKYLFAATVRRDGSSNFTEENRYGTFPSVSAGWRISQEKFMESIPFINELKLRASYGSVGNQNIDALLFNSTYNNDGGNFGYSFGGTPTLTPGIYPNILGNRDIMWEKLTEANVGFDASLMNGRFSLTVDYYKKKYIDLLGNVPLPFYSAPYTGQYQANAFTMENDGLELSGGYNQRFGKVNFSLNANFATINNKVTSLLPGNTSGFLSQSISIMGSAFNDGGAQTRTYVGEQVGNFWGYVFDGIIQNEAELEASGMKSLNETVMPGDVKFKDVSGPEGKPDGKITSDDRTFIGNGLPGFIYGFNARVEFRGFDLNVFCNGQGDVQIANMTKLLVSHMRFHNSTGIVGAHRDLLNSWKGEGTSNTVPRNSYTAPTTNRYFSTANIENGAFLRIRNIQLGYTLPANIGRLIRTTSARVYVSVQNLHTFTKYSGYDPEIGNSSIGTRVQTAGVDFGRYPKTRIYTAGINLQF